jgi:DNA invertase Pin-like site-specific DNA recombinase
MPPGTVLDEKKAALAQRMHASGESASTIATALGVSRATVYRVLVEQAAEGD